MLNLIRRLGRTDNNHVSHNDSDVQNDSKMTTVTTPVSFKTQDASSPDELSESCHVHCCRSAEESGAHAATSSSSSFRHSRTTTLPTSSHSSACSKSAHHDTSRNPTSNRPCVKSDSAVRSAIHGCVLCDGTNDENEHTATANNENVGFWRSYLCWGKRRQLYSRHPLTLAASATALAATQISDCDVTRNACGTPTPAAVTTTTSATFTRKVGVAPPVPDVCSPPQINQHLPAALQNVKLAAQTVTKRTIIVGDVHGCLDELKALLTHIGYRNPPSSPSSIETAGQRDTSRKENNNAGNSSTQVDNGEKEEPHDRLIFVGDLVGKGPCSVEVVMYVMSLGAECVMGNWEWNLIHRPNMLEADYKRFAPQMTQAPALSETQWSWIKALPPYLHVPEYNVVVAHAGLMPGVDLAQQVPRDLMSMRNIIAVPDDNKLSTNNGSESDTTHPVIGSTNISKNPINSVQVITTTPLSSMRQAAASCDNEAACQQAGLPSLPMSAKTTITTTTATATATMIAPTSILGTTTPSAVLSNAAMRVTKLRATSDQDNGGCAWTSMWNGPYFVVFGHDARRGLQQTKYALGIDTGCVYGDYLTAYVLPEGRIYSVRACRRYAECTDKQAIRMSPNKYETQQQQQQHQQSQPCQRQQHNSRNQQRCHKTPVNTLQIRNQHQNAHSLPFCTTQQMESVLDPTKVYRDCKSSASLPNNIPKINNNLRSKQRHRRRRKRQSLSIDRSITATNIPPTARGTTCDELSETDSRRRRDGEQSFDEEDSDSWVVAYGSGRDDDSD